VACFTLGWATSSSTSSNWPARLPASRVARPNGGTVGMVFDPVKTSNNCRTTLRLTSLGLGNTGELVLFVPRDLDGVLQPLLEVLDMSLLPGELPLEFVDAGLGRGSVHGIDDLTGLAVKRLPRLLSVVRHLGDAAVLAEKDGKGAGNPLRD